MDREVFMLLVGAAVALVSSVVTALVQHLLSLRVDRIRRDRDKKEEWKEKWVRDVDRIVLRGTGLDEIVISGRIAKTDLLPVEGEKEEGEGVEGEEEG